MNNPSMQPALYSPCPPAVEDIFRLCGVDPDSVAADWMDIFVMVGEMQPDFYRQ